MSLTYTSYVTDLANLMVVSPTDTNYLTVLPNIIDDAEQRIYRECDFLRTIVVENSSASCTITADTRSFTVPSSVTYVVTDSLSALSTDATPSRTPLCPVSREWLNTVYPTATSSSTSAIPLYFAMVTDQSVIVGPPPGRDVVIEYTGTTRPTALSSTNTTTYLATNLPDLFMAASMVFANAYMKNFAATADDPQAPMTWEGHFQKLKQSAMEEEFRKKFGSQGWTSKQINPVATPPRS